MEDLTCSICADLFVDPVLVSDGEHVFCRKCITDWMRTNDTCPMCREVLSKDLVRAAPQIKQLNQMIVPCGDCKWTGERQKLEKHKKECDLFPVKCSYGCDITRGELGSHECRSKCAHCKQLFLDLSQHECPEEMIECSCGWVQRKHGCPNELKCDFYGCKALYKKGDDHILSHIKEASKALQERDILEKKLSKALEDKDILEKKLSKALEDKDILEKLTEALCENERLQPEEKSCNIDRDNARQRIEVERRIRNEISVCRAARDCSINMGWQEMPSKCKSKR